MPSVAQGVSARRDSITGFLPVYTRCNGTIIDDSTWPVSVKAEMVTSGREISWKSSMNLFSVSCLLTD